MIGHINKDLKVNEMTLKEIENSLKNIPVLTSLPFNWKTNYYYEIQGSSFSTIYKYGNICWVMMYVNCKTGGTAVECLEVPTPVNSQPHWEFECWEADDPGKPLVAYINDDGILRMRNGTAGKNYFINIMYMCQ